MSKTTKEPKAICVRCVHYSYRGGNPYLVPPFLHGCVEGNELTRDAVSGELLYRRPVASCRPRNPHGSCRQFVRKRWLGLL